MGMLLRRHYEDRDLSNGVVIAEVEKETKKAEDKPKKAKASGK